MLHYKGTVPHTIPFFLLSKPSELSYRFPSRHLSAWAAAPLTAQSSHARAQNPQNWHQQQLNPLENLGQTSPVLRVNKSSQQHPAIFPDAWRGCGLSAAQGRTALKSRQVSSPFQEGQEGSRAGDTGCGSSRTAGTLLSQARAAGRTFQPQPLRQSAKPGARRAVTASLQKDTRTLEHTRLISPQ